MNMRFLIPGLLVIGLCLLLAGLSWNSILPSSAYWTPQQAEEFSAAQTELHAQWHKRAHGHYESEAEAVKARFEKIADELRNARASQSRWKITLITTGVVTLVTGIVLHLNRRQSG